jgi:ribonucleases P/MRP protein subunit RPP40
LKLYLVANKKSQVSIVDRLLNWIKAFLGDRFQRVVLGDNISEWIRVLSGVPQGSVLGPLLFVIFINDLVKNLPDSCKCKLFADDTKLISIIKCNQDCDKLQLGLGKLVQWSNTWLLKFNNDKCKVMHC